VTDPASVAPARRTRAPRLADAPRLTPAQAAELARHLYDVDGSASPLPSERDQNFLVRGTRGEPIVLKIANSGEELAMLHAQRAVLAHLASRMSITPRVIPAGAHSTGEPDPARPDAPTEPAPPHAIWAITHLPGDVLATLPHRSTTLLASLGREIASLRRALADFDHAAIHRDFYWDLANGRRIIDELRPLLSGGETAAAIEALIDRYDRHTVPLVASLPRQAIHNDLNDHNLLVVGERITGIVDFGDMVYGWAVGDLAIAAAYVALGADDPLGAIATLVRAYDAEHRLTDVEIGSLFGLIALRLCTSVCIAQDQRAQRPDNDYLVVSQEPIRRLLPTLAGIQFGLAEAVLREACGRSPSPRGDRVRAWLAAQRADFAPVVPWDLRTDPCLVLDLGIGSALVSGDERENAEPKLTARIFAAMRDADVDVGIGRYDEPRLLYTSSIFTSGSGPLDERRTVHIGLDLFAPAGTPVQAPIDGVVHAFADNRSRLDYGPVIILRHTTGDGDEFFTLYGHLSRASLDGLNAGRRVARGEQIATIGTPDENVGWTPHVHLQVIADLLERGTDFPGVGRPSERNVWRSLCPDPNLIVGVPAERFPPPTPPLADTLATRRRLFGSNVGIAYREPVRIVRGWMQYLFDADGRRYLDAYNNVPHVGHAHPRVVRAGAEQMAIVNTNTRYLSDVVNVYAERLAATFPAPLRVCYLLNSASEANELALRLARAYTGRRDMLVLDGGYHGNTTTLIDLSPYKHAGPGGRGAPDWVHVAPLPDDYRGPYRRNDPDAGPKYARHAADVIDSVRSRGRAIAGFIAETCPSVGGQIVLPPRYLSEVYRHVRAAGGVCIADEVQTGLGRMGAHFWAFESHDVVPDIVVMGKPLGNGHPIGAVMTTRAIADAFDTGMEFFSTFGGNTVSCAIGLEVLEVVRDEGLQAHALRVGERMLAGLHPLIDRYPLVGDVRGSGLFIGVEFVRDRETLEPAADEAAYVVDRLRERRILLGTDGPHHNVLKIRPPMPFSEADSDILVAAIERALIELRFR
jgi:4-aminobutyrate aminotransferase-like enzyme/Ser/Thr protein kinase RdoA (MazF antagonist)